MNTKNPFGKSIVLVVAIAAVSLVAMVGSASADHACVADDGSGDAYFCGDTVTKSCTFNGSMTCSGSEHGIIIGADGIVIDGYNETACGGKCWINGSSPATCDVFTYWSGIYDAGGYDHVTIKNLEILHFCNGIFLRETALNEYYTIENCTIHDIGTGPTQGINLKMLNHGTVNNCTIYNVDGTGDGCGAGGDGIFLLGSCGSPGYARNNTFTYNNISHNRKGGIFIKGAPDYNNISYNKLWENGEVSAGETGGIILRCKQSNNNTIEHNNVSNNVGDGIYIGGANNSIRYNNVTSNRNSTDDTVKGRGIVFDRCDENDWGGYLNPENNTIFNNRFCYNEYKDIDVEEADCEAHVNGDDNTCDWTHNYNDAGTTGCTYRCMHAYRYQNNSRPPTTCDVPNTGFTVFPREDETDEDGYYATHRFNFSVIWDSDEINKINVTWHGRGWHDAGDQYNGTYLYIWNKTGSTGYNDDLDNNSGVGTKGTLTGEKTSNIDNYINSGNVTIVVVQKSTHNARERQSSHIETDYVRFKLEVTPDP